VKVLKCDYDPTNGLEDHDAMMQAVRKHVEKLHLAVSKNGQSYVAIIDRGDGNIRILSGSELGQVTTFIEETAKTDGPHANVALFTIMTVQ
jgi:hypothetical protein